VLDIGAGRGVITAHLIAAGAQVMAFELHPQRAQHLRARFGGGVVRVVRADATDLRLPRRPFRVVANPPFAITTALLRRLVAPGSRLVRADLVVPFHVARRWVEGPAPGERRWRTCVRDEGGRSCAITCLFAPRPTLGRAGDRAVARTGSSSLSVPWYFSFVITRLLAERLQGPALSSRRSCAAVLDTVKKPNPWAQHHPW